MRTAPPAISDSKLPTVAQNRSPSVLQTSDSESSLPSSSSLVPNLSKCQDVRYECHDCVPGASYKSADGRDEWTPVIRRKRRSAMKNLESESSESDSEVDVSCSRKVEYEKRDGIPGLSIYRRGPAKWTPILARRCEEPIAARTRSKALITILDL